jgi:Glycosyl transferases group 1
MRVAVIGAGKRYRTEASIAHAVRSLGHPCRLVDVLGWTNRLGRLALPFLQRYAQAFESDLVILTRAAYRLGEDNLRALVRGRRSAFWYFDIRDTPREETLTLARLADVMYTTYLQEVAVFRAAGIADVRFLPQGMDPELDRPASRIPAEYRCDVSFIGSAGGADRHAILRSIAEVADVQIRGPGWEQARGKLPVRGGPLWGPRFAQAVGGAKISLGANSVVEQAAQRASASNRMWKVLGCGGFFLGRYVEGIEHFARDGVYCAWYRDNADAVAKVREYLADPERRQRIAAAGRAHALAHHTYAHRLELLLAGRGYELA